MKSKTIELLYRQFKAIAEIFKVAKEEAEVAEKKTIAKKLSKMEITDVNKN